MLDRVPGSGGRPRRRCIRCSANRTLAFSSGLVLPSPFCTLVMLDRYRRTVAGVLLAVISSMKATSVSGPAVNGGVRWRWHHALNTWTSARSARSVLGLIAPLAASM